MCTCADNQIDTPGVDVLLSTIEYQNKRGLTSQGIGLLNLSLTVSLKIKQ